MQLVPKTLDFRAKMLLQKIATILPYGFYRFLVERHPKLLHADYDKMIKYYISNCNYIRPYGLDLQDKVIVETGTGACLADPITFYLAGAAKIYTFDIRLHVNPQHVWGIIDHYAGNLKELSKVMRVSYNDVFERWDVLKKIRRAKDVQSVPRKTDNRYYLETNNFQEFLSATNIQIYESQIIPKDIEKNSVDIFFSNSVLQRPSFKLLKQMVYDAGRILKDDGVFWHKIDPRDINWLYDKRISEYHYLKYSDFFLKIISSKVYNNQNRLRQSDYLKLFGEAGFIPIFLRSQRPDNYKEQISEIKLNKRFRGYALEDIAVTNFIIYAGREHLLKNKKPVYELHEFPASVENQFL